MNRPLIALLCCWVFFSCKSRRENSPIQNTERVVLQPFRGFPRQEVNKLLPMLEKILVNLRVAETVELPSAAFYQPRNRYKADSLLSFLKSRSDGAIYLGLTNQDISTSKGNLKDWGVMGLSYCPGKASIVSDFRLRENDRGADLFKVVVHELGHANGLPHCRVKTCYMRDAEGGYPLKEETAFCEDCRKYLKIKGWRL